MQSIPGDDVEQSEHTCPSACARLPKVREVFEVVGGDIAVDGKLTVLR